MCIHDTYVGRYFFIRIELCAYIYVYVQYVCAFEEKRVMG